MLTRFIYWAVSIVFFLLATALWLTGIVGIVLQFTAEGFCLPLFFVTVMAFAAAVVVGQCGGEARRAVRSYC